MKGAELMVATRHFGLLVNPRKRKRKSLLRSATGTIGVMSDFREVPASEIPPETPPGKENEVLAGLIPVEGDNAALISEMRAMKKMLEEQAAATAALQALMPPSKALILRFVADYLYEVCQFGAREIIPHTNFYTFLVQISGGERAPVTIELKHTIEGLKKTFLLDKEMAKHLMQLKPLMGDISDRFCHCAALKGAAICLLDNDVGTYIRKKEALSACKALAEAIFGPLQLIATSEDPIFNTVITIPRYAKHGQWKK